MYDWKVIIMTVAAFHVYVGIQLRPDISVYLYKCHVYKHTPRVRLELQFKVSLGSSILHELLELLHVAVHVALWSAGAVVAAPLSCCFAGPRGEQLGWDGAGLAAEPHVIKCL